MANPWNVLRRAGVPLGTCSPEPPVPAPTAPEIAAAVLAAVASSPTGRARDALAAFVLSWRRRWPYTFLRELGTEAAGLVQWAEAATRDPNRYLKLARIATAHLAHIL